MNAFVAIADLMAIGVFAASGALVASRKQMDVIGFGLMASLTGVGGGTLRDLLLGRPVIWISDPLPLIVCLAVAVVLFFSAHIFQRRYTVLLWADGLGLAMYGVMGAELARASGAGILISVVMGMMTATFGGLIRDIVCGETPLVLGKEVYATCAVLAAATHALLMLAGVPLEAAATAGFAAGFGLRALGITRGLSLPVYKARPGREY